jgi:hypothetical protein
VLADVKLSVDEELVLTVVELSVDEELVLTVVELSVDEELVTTDVKLSVDGELVTTDVKPSVEVELSPVDVELVVEIGLDVLVTKKDDVELLTPDEKLLDVEEYEDREEIDVLEVRPEEAVTLDDGDELVAIVLEVDVMDDDVLEERLPLDEDEVDDELEELVVALTVVLELEE